ncbi:hypothetical protein MRX96_014460 [Rhipicephalus microplus]
MTTSAGHSLASDAVHQQWCLAPAALPVRPPTVLRMLRPGPRALAIPTRDCTYINRRDIIAAFSGSGGTIAMTPTHHTPLSFVQLLVMACCSCGAITNASAAMTATRAHRFGSIMAGPSSSFWKASSARLVGDSMRVRPWNPPSGPRPLLDDYAVEAMRALYGVRPGGGRTNSATTSPAPTRSPARADYTSRDAVTVGLPVALRVVLALIPTEYLAHELCTAFLATNEALALPLIIGQECSH